MRALLLEIRPNLALHELAAGLRLVVKIVLPLGIFFILLQLTLGDESVGRLTRDPNAVSKAPFYVGTISMIGVSIWLAAAQTAFMGSAIAPAQSAHRRLLFGYGCLTAFLALDDMLQMHEQVLPFYLGIPEVLTYLVYAVVAIYVLVRYLPTLMRNEPAIFLSAAGLLGLSVVVDLIPARTPVLHYFAIYALEDGCKFAGIVLWAVYFSRYVLRLARGEAR